MFYIYKKNNQNTTKLTKNETINKVSKKTIIITKNQNYFLYSNLNKSLKLFNYQFIKAHINIYKNI